MKKTEFYNIYGQTEANSSTFFQIRELPDNDSWKTPIGKVFPNFEVYAIAGNGRTIQDPGETGELYINSSTVALGYWNDPGKSAESFVQDPRCLSSRNISFRTGDLVKLDNDSNYVFVGRRDHMIKTRGYRVQLDEIEAILNTHNKIKEAVAVAIPDEFFGNRIISFVSANENKKVTEAETINYCADLLPSYMIPEKIILMERFPRTPTGKVDRKHLREIAENYH